MQKKDGERLLFFYLRFCFLYVKRFENEFYNLFARFGVDGVYDIFILAFLRFSARHRDKITVVSFDNFNVVYNKAIVEEIAVTEDKLKVAPNVNPYVVTTT